MALKILLADDNLTAQNMGKKILTEAGYEVIAVSNGAQAMKRIASDKPDLAVLDVYMPGYSGLELCERIRNTHETAATPVVLSVGKMEAFQSEEGTRVRANGVIVKPFEASELLAMIKKLAEEVPADRPATGSAEESAQPPENAIAAEPVDSEPELHARIEVPQEIAATPAIGMDLINEPAQPPASDAQPASAEVPASAPLVEEPAGPIEFEVEHHHEPAPSEPYNGPRLHAAEGLSGVFEVEPSGSSPAMLEAAAVTPDSFATPAPEGFETFAAEAPAVSQPKEAAHHAAGFEHGAAFEPFPALEPVMDTPAASHPWPAPDFEQTSAAPVPVESIPEPAVVSAVPAAVPEPMPELAPPDFHPQASVPAAASPVWEAEEVGVEPNDSSVSLHDEMVRSGMNSLSAWEAHVPAQEAASSDPLAYSHSDSEASEAEVTEIPADPTRIASIVDQVLERMKPDLIAAITRELEKNKNQ